MSRDTKESLHSAQCCEDVHWPGSLEHGGGPGGLREEMTSELRPAGRGGSHSWSPGEGGLGSLIGMSESLSPSTSWSV